MLCLIFGTLFFIPFVNAATSYEIKAEEDKDYIWTLNTLDENDMADLFGDDWDDDDFWRHSEQGARMKIEISKIEDKEPYPYDTDYDAFLIVYDIWYFDDYEGDKWGDEDVQDVPIYSLMDPSDYEEIYGKDAKMTFTQYGFFWPVDTASYWDEINWKDNVDIDGSKATILYDKGDYVFGSPCEEDCILEASVNGDGILSDIKLLNDKDKVIVEFTLNAIPGYEITLLIGIIIIFSIGLIYIGMKKRKISEF
ncbi:MAG: hypothetical protein ACTSQP_08710 [Promethearchaeota archaeon]